MPHTVEYMSTHTQALCSVPYGLCEGAALEERSTGGTGARESGAVRRRIRTAKNTASPRRTKIHTPTHTHPHKHAQGGCH